jgi:hypothetical protein
MYMWHCHLSHVGVKRTKKLHKDGLLASLDFDSFDTCEPCLMGKMTKTPFTGSVIGRPTYWESYIPMCVDRWESLWAMGIVTLWPLLITWVDMGISIWWSISLKPLNSSRNFKMRSKINSIGKSSTFVLIKGASIWGSILRCILRRVEMCHNVCQLEHRSVTACLSDVIALC